MLANVTVTSGGIAFAGDLGGTLYAVNTETGEVLLRHGMGASAGGGLISYMLAGKQFVAVVSGPVSPFFGGGKLVFGTWIIVLFLTCHWIAHQAPLTLKTIRRTRA